MGDDLRSDRELVMIPANRLKTLEEHDTAIRADRARRIELSKLPRLNGIACPKCGEELVDAQPFMSWRVDGSDFPRASISCPACGYRGYRLA